MRLKEFLLEQTLSDAVTEWAEDAHLPGWAYGIQGSQLDIFDAGSRTPVKMVIVDLRSDVVEFSPTKINSFDLSTGVVVMQVTGTMSLKNLPRYVKCNLMLFQYCKDITDWPKVISGSVSIQNCEMKNLKGMPEEIRKGDLSIFSLQNLESLEGISKDMDNRILSIRSCNKLKSLIGIGDLIAAVGEIQADFDNFTTGGLGLLQIHGLKVLKDANQNMPEPFKIIEKYLGKPDALFECQQELIDAGFEEYAQL